MIDVSTNFYRAGAGVVAALVPFAEVPKVGHIVLIEPSTMLVSVGPSPKVAVAPDRGSYVVTEVLWHQPEGRAGFVPHIQLKHI